MIILRHGLVLLVALVLTSGRAPGEAGQGFVETVLVKTAVIGMTEMATGTTLALKAKDSEPDRGELASSERAEADDGASNAPACVIQHPSLLNGYKVRPFWRVAGVDYCVGYPASRTLKDPGTLSVSGVSVDRINKFITVTGNNVTLDGYDFSSDGGWGLSIEAANTSIVNSRFVVGANAKPPIQGKVAASNLHVSYSVIDGGGIDVGNTGLIQMKGVGLTVRYSWVTNSAGDMIQAHNSGIVDLRYNLIEQGGLAQGAHGDFLEVFGGPFEAIILYNTTIQHRGGSGGTQGLMLEPDFLQRRGVIKSGEYGSNTFVASGGNQNYFLGITVADIVDIVAVHDNYFDPTGTYGFAPGGIRGGPDDGSSKTVFVNNVNMSTGAIVQDTGRPATPSQR